MKNTQKNPLAAHVNLAHAHKLPERPGDLGKSWTESVSKDVYRAALAAQAAASKAAGVAFQSDEEVGQDGKQAGLGKDLLPKAYSTAAVQSLKPLAADGPIRAPENHRPLTVAGEKPRVLLTGASGGIGHALAQILLAGGCCVTLSGTNAQKLERLQTSLLEAMPQAKDFVFTVPSKLQDPEAPEQLTEKASEHMGGVDVLINNAGLTRDGLLMRMSDADMESVLALNLVAAMRLSRAVLKGMMKARRGVIVNISSVVASMGNAGQTNYVASKAGLEGFTRSLALEVASRGIRVNALAPGFIATPMTDVLSDAHKEKLLANIPLRRMGTPQDIAKAAAFLVSDDAAYITGTTLHVNGGLFCA